MTKAKTISTLAVGAAIVTGSMFAVNATSAQSNSNRDVNKAERITALADKLGVDESKVETAFSELRAEHQADREAKNAEHIASLVTNGTLSQDQADALETKQSEQKAAREALKDQDLSREEMHTQMQTEREDFQTWADDQGIDLNAIRPEGAHKGHHGPMDGPEDGPDSGTTDAPDSGIQN